MPVKVYRKEAPSLWWVPLWMIWGIAQIPLVAIAMVMLLWWRWARLTQLRSHRDARTFHKRMSYRLLTAMMGYTMMRWEDDGNPFTKTVGEAASQVAEALGDQKTQG